MKNEANGPGKSIFNLQRFQILHTKLIPQTAYLIPDSYAYAWYIKMFPLLDQCELHEDLEDYFSIPRDHVEIISKFADDEWLGKRLYTFYEYEKHFNCRRNPDDGIKRWTLISVFRYLYLRGGFDEMFWSKLLEPEQYPTEAIVITT